MVIKRDKTVMEGRWGRLAGASTITVVQRCTHVPASSSNRVLDTQQRSHPPTATKIMNGSSEFMTSQPHFELVFAQAAHSKYRSLLRGTTGAPLARCF